MGMKCKVTGCYLTRVQYFKLPESQRIRKRWIRAIGKQLEWEREKPKNPAKWFVCSAHFSEDCFVPNDKNFVNGVRNPRRSLLPTAVPNMGLGNDDFSFVQFSSQANSVNQGQV